MSSQKLIGELLREQGYITDEQLREALQTQARPGETRLLGQILVARGHATSPQIQVALSRQRRVSEVRFA